MWFESVTAHAFGLHRGKTLRLGRALTVVYGPNEAGKSTWHAALYAALCGVRRGARRKEDAAFKERHFPWQGGVWEVSATIQLDDGRRIELRQELDGKVDCRATELPLGTDVSDEIINEGSPDGARWLGLDRRSFVSTACVRQAEIQSILNEKEKEPGKLQEYLQRAAATASKDGTAAAALGQLGEFKKEHVGLDRANVRKPLRRALERVERARRALEDATRIHSEYVALVQRAQGLQEQADRELRAWTAARAAKARYDAAVARGRLDRARELGTRHPEAPAGLPDDEAIARQVAEALAAWRTRPEVPALSGATTGELRMELAVLPAPPRGDTAVDAGVRTAATAYGNAAVAVRLHEDERVPEPLEPQGCGTSAEELRQLALELSLTAPMLDASVVERHVRAQRRLDGLSAGKVRSRAILMAAAVLFLSAAGCWALDQHAGAIALALAGAAAASVAAWFSARTGITRAKVLGELRDLETALGEDRHAAHEIERKLEAARLRVSELGVPADPRRLRDLAQVTEDASRQREDLERWHQKHADLLASRAEARLQLRNVLRLRGVALGDGDDPRRVVEDYRRCCEENLATQNQAARQRDLERQLRLREGAEHSAQEAISARQGAEAALRKAAGRCGVQAQDPEVMSRALTQWQETCSRSLASHERELEEWAELQALLEGGTVEDLAAQAERLERQAVVLESSVTPGDEVELAQDPEAQIHARHSEYERAALRAAEARGRVEAASLPSVAEAEEELESAQREVERVRRLDRTLSSTIEFLVKAQDRVHKDIAPILAKTVHRWLGEVTGGRYVDALVDPSTLKVQVCGADRRWRDASLLSHGTAEQVYLLLRIALASHLATTGETCPLILDEVTVQSDRERTRALLECLHAVSRERQVILFTQEQDVLEWAEGSLREEEGDLLERLGPVAAIM